jgi:hypothetical protein
MRRTRTRFLCATRALPYSCDMPETTREAALELAETLLSDIELERISTADVARRASRLARLLSDAEAMQWLRFETYGYPDGPLSREAWAAAVRSGRVVPRTDDGTAAHTISLGEIDAQLAAYQSQLENAAHFGERNAAIEGITRQSRRPRTDSRGAALVRG